MSNNETRYVVTPDVPKAIADEQIFVYVPTATNSKPGIIQPDNTTLEIVNYKLKIKAVPASCITDLNTLSLITSKSDAFNKDIIAEFNITSANTTVALTDFQGATIYWGDDSVSSVSTATVEHSYSAIGKYTCRITNAVSIPIYGFYGCTPLVSVIIPNTISEIHDNAFKNCTNLNKVKIPDSVIIIDNEVFSGCSSMTSIYMSRNIRMIASDAFAGCSDLLYVYFEGSRSKWNSISIDTGNTDLTNATIYYGEYSGVEWTEKQDTLTPTQLTAVNSGIDATKVAQIATNASNITNKLDKVSAANKIYGTDANGSQTTYNKDSFSQVDDVQISRDGTVSSIVSNKIATILYETGLGSDSNNAATVTAIRAFVNSSIEAVAAYYITADATGNAFATKAALDAGPWYYAGSTRTPTRNDYAIVIADETHSGNTARYTYVKADGATTGSWNFQYTFNMQFTQAQIYAINSGITAAKLAELQNKHVYLTYDGTYIKQDSIIISTPYAIILTYINANRYIEIYHTISGEIYRYTGKDNDALYFSNTIHKELNTLSITDENVIAIEEHESEVISNRQNTLNSSQTNYPTCNAVKTYADGLLAGVVDIEFDLIY